MFNSFSTALSALKGDSAAVNVISNNLANLNTTGFKESSVSFADLVGQAFGNSEPGFGVASVRIDQNFNQGAVQSSSGNLDAAINGNGFFSVKTGSGQQLFTRDGHFQVDANGNLKTASGEFVQGWSTTDSGTVNTTGPIGNIRLPGGAIRQAVPTTQFALNMNLDSTSAIPTTTSPNFSQSIQVIDSQGSSHLVTVDFTKTANNAWTYSVSIPGDEITGGTAGKPSQLASGTLAFDANGKLTAPAATTNGGAIPIAINTLTDGAANLSINWKLYDDAGAGTISQLAAKSGLSTATQDGVQSGRLTKLAMRDHGLVTASYDNGQETVVATLAIADIRNPSSLLGAGNNNLQATAATAIPSIGIPNTGGRGDVAGGSLESSTVDIASEFTNLIVMQRAYQANGKVITTADQITQETINLKQ